MLWVFLFSVYLHIISPLRITGMSVYTLASTCKCVCDIFLFPCLLPLFVWSDVNEIFVLHICLHRQSSVLRSCCSGGIRKMTERATLGIRGLKMRDYSNADYYVDYEKKVPVFNMKMMKIKIKSE